MKELVYTYSLNLQIKLKEESSAIAAEKKWVEQQKKVNRKLRQKDLYENSVYIGNLYVQTKIMIRSKRTYPLSHPSTPVTVFLIAEKLLNL